MHRLCEYLLPITLLVACQVGLVLILERIPPSVWVIVGFVASLLLSVFISVLSPNICRMIYTCRRLPQHGFMSGDILGLMILIRRGRNCTGLKIEAIKHSAFAEVFHDQAAKQAWRAFGCFEKFFIIKGYLTLDVLLNDRHLVAVTNAHLNTGAPNPERIFQVRELFEKAIPENRPVLLFADTNAHHTEPEMKWITKDGKMIDTYAEIHNDPEFRLKTGRTSRGDGYTWHADNPLTRGFLAAKNMRIDYVWFRNALVKQSPAEILSTGNVLGNERARALSDTVPVADAVVPARKLSSRAPRKLLKLVDSAVKLDQPPYYSDHFCVCADLEILA
eukprot:130608_1